MVELSRLPMPANVPRADDRIRVLRVITRLNVGGPSIQAMTLSDRLTPRGFDTLLVHGRLDAGEGDMRYLLPPTVDASGICRRCGDRSRPPHDALALAQLLDVMRDFRPQIVHTHMAKAGTLGRLAAAIYNRTAGRGRPRPRRAHLSRPRARGIFQPGEDRDSSSASSARWRALTDRIVAISPRIRDRAARRLSHRPRRSVPRRAARLRSVRARGDRRRARGRARARALDISPAARGRHHGRPADGDQAARAVPRGRARIVAARDPDAHVPDRRRRRAARRARSHGARARHRRPRALSRLAARPRDHLRRDRCVPADVAQRRHAGRADREPGRRRARRQHRCRRRARRRRERRHRPARGRRRRDGARRSRHCAARRSRSASRAWARAGRALVLARYGLDRLVDDVEALYRELLH